MVKPAAKKEVVHHLMKGYAVSLRRACRLLGMNTSSYYQKRDLSGSDVASFCELYANWGKAPPR